jgi:hypothetical protein
MRPGMTVFENGEGPGAFTPNPVLGAIGSDRLLVVKKPASRSPNLHFCMGDNGSFRSYRI